MSPFVSLVLSGNVYDLQLAEIQPDQVVASPLVETLATELRAHNGARTVAYNPVGGFRVLDRRALVLSHRARPRPVGVERRAAYNTVIWVVDREGDLPDWLLIGNPRIRHIPVSRPDHRVRRAIVPLLLRAMPGAGRDRAPLQALAIPSARWVPPPHQAYLGHLLEFFEQKAVAAIRRGPLARMTVTRTG